MLGKRLWFGILQVMEPSTHTTRFTLDWLQRVSLVGMLGLLLLTFTATNLQALLWQSSDWLVGAVLPAVVIDLTNAERTEGVALPLRRSNALDAAATAKAKHMAANEYFAHYAPDGTTPWEFFDGVGYVYAHAGENLAIHFSDSTEVIEAWMNSPAHRANIVDTKFTEIGVGTAKGEYDGYPTVYVVQLFGTPAAPPTPPPAVSLVPVAKPPATAPPPSLVTTAVPMAVEEEAPVVTGAQPVGTAEVALTETTELTLATPTTTLSTLEELSAVPSTTVLGVSEVTEDTFSEAVLGVAPATNTLPLLSDAAFPAVGTAVPTQPVLTYSHLATSSGLLAATTELQPDTHAGATITALATQPSVIFQAIYSVLAVVIALLLTAAAIYETRRRRFIQVAYSGGLLALLIGLSMVHTLLTAGAVIV